MTTFFWKAILIKEPLPIPTYKIGLAIYEDSIPKLFIVCCLSSRIGYKKKWKDPIKIKRWILYNSTNSYATHFVNPMYKGLGKKEILYSPDKIIISKRFSMCKDEFIRKKKKRK